MLYRNPQLKDRAAAAFELWEVQDGQFTQYAQRYSAAPGTGPAHFIEAIIFKWMASWVMSYWAVLWEGGPHPGTLGDFLEVKKWRDCYVGERGVRLGGLVGVERDVLWGDSCRR